MVKSMSVKNISDVVELQSSKPIVKNDGFSIRLSLIEIIGTSDFAHIMYFQ